MGTMEKILQLLNYLASIQPGGKIDEMRAYKLIWLIDRYHLRQYGRTVTGDSYNAEPYGIVPSVIASEYISKSQEKKNKSLKDSNMRVFSESDVDAINVILGAYGKMDYRELSKLSYEFPEWRYYEDRINDDGRKSNYKVDMNLFFENYDDGRGLFMDSTELIDLTMEVYNQYKGY